MDKERGAAKHSADVGAKWHAAVANIGNHFLKMQGLDVGPCEIVLHVRPCEGLTRQLDGSIEKRFAPKELLCPIQVEALSLLFRAFPKSLNVVLEDSVSIWLPFGMLHGCS